MGATSRQTALRGSHHIGVRLFVTVYLVYGVMNNWDVSFVHDNTLGLSQAIAYGHTVCVKGYVSPKNYDIAERDGKLYSGAPPGISFVSVPFTLLLTPLWKRLPSFIVPEGTDSMSREVPLVEMHSYLINMLAGAFLCLLLFKAGALFGYDEKISLLTALTGAFGTILFLYGSDFFQRPLAALCLFASFLMLARMKRGVWAHVWYLWAAAGLVWGASCLFEYSASIPMAVLGLYLLSFHRGRGVIYFALGALPALAVFFGYNQLAWGSPFGTPHFYLKNYPGLYPENPVEWMKYMNWNKAWQLLFSEYTGYFFYMPALAFGVVGLARWFRRGEYRMEATAAASIFALMYFLNVAIPSWAGGRNPGPRLMITTVPFMALAVGEGLRGIRGVFAYPVIGASVFLNWLLALYLRYGGRDQLVHYLGNFVQYGPTPYPVRMLVSNLLLKGSGPPVAADIFIYWAAGTVVTVFTLLALKLVWRGAAVAGGGEGQ